MEKFQPIATPIEGLVLIRPTVWDDDRGFFLESWTQRDFDALLGTRVEFVQDNHSKSARGVLRGLHVQRAGAAQGKLVRVVGGAVYDVAVDLRGTRATNPTYGRWFGVELSAENKLLFYIPPGFAHGFLTLEEGTEFLYRCTDYYAPDRESGVRWDDPTIGVDWRLEHYGLSSDGLLLSEKDRQLPFL